MKQRPHYRLGVAGALVTAGLSVALLAGCGPTGTPGPLVSPSSGTPSPSSPPSPSTSPSTPPSPGLPPGRRPPGHTTPPPPAAALETHTGTVTNGVEPACLILKASDGTYELLGGDKAVLRPNTQVIVQGYRPKGLMSHCMQGVLFHVVSAKKA